jgi:cytochrome c peroxidase
LKRWLTITALAIFIVAGAILLDSCKKNNPPEPATPINFVIPPGFPPTTYSFASNPLTEEGFLLGRKLFYEKRLSVDGTVFCGSCHQPEAAFTTLEHDRSHGVNHNHTLRNAPGLFNLAWYPYFNQDGSTQSLQSIYQNHISNQKEMGESVGNVINKIKNDTAYKRMFRAAFGDENVTADRMFRALTQFVINLVSANSKYDKVLQGQASFNGQEQNGYTVFRAKCASCHTEPLFTDFSFRNIGLEMDVNLHDYGRMLVTGNLADSLKFRVPSLRNVELTSYYTHDGRINMMRTVIKHYETGVNQSPSLDPLLANGITLSPTEEDDLVQFLRTLSDSTFLNNPRYRQ